MLHLAGPARARPFRLRDRHLFVAIVAVPTLLAAAYMTMLASDRFVSETRYIVRGAETASAGAAGIASLMRVFGLAADSDPGHAVDDYLVSRDALRALSERLPMPQILAPGNVDPLASCGWPGRTVGFETLYDCYADRVTVRREPDGVVSRLEVDLFDAGAAEAVASALLGLGEAFANGLNARGEAEMLDGLRADAAAAEAQTRRADERIAAFRTSAGVVDLAQAASASADRSADLTAELVRTRAAIARAQVLAPLAPALASMTVRMEALEAGIAAENEALFSTGAAAPGRMPTYETLLLEREIAAAGWQAAAAALERGRIGLEGQQVFLQRIVEPNRPDEARRPRRLRAVASVLAVSLALFGMCWLVVTGAREHADLV